MSNQLIATIIRYGNQLVEGYRRVTRADKAELERLNLDPNTEYNTLRGVQPVSEYIVFQTVNIKQGQYKTFDTSRWGDSLAFESLYIDSPTSDSLDLEIWDKYGNRFIKQPISKNKTPMLMPTNPIPNDILIRVRAKSDIAFIRLVAVPCKILASIYAEEDYGNN